MTLRILAVIFGDVQGKEGKPTVILEAVASYDAWKWHAFVGMPGTLNDINVLNCSPFLVKVICGKFSKPPYTLHRTERTNAYFLAFTHNCPVWSKLYRSLVLLPSNTLPKGKKEQGRMLRGPLHCFNVGFGFLHSTCGFGLKKKCI